MGYLNAEQTDQLLKEPIISVITTLRADGAPHMTPVWHLKRGDEIVVAVDATSVKARNVRRNPTAALCVAANESPQRWALVNGNVTTTRENVEEIVTAMAFHYMPDGEAGAYAEKVLRELDFVLLVISPTRVVAFDGLD